MKDSIKYIISIGASGFLVKLFEYIPWGRIFKGENWQWLMTTRFNWLHVILFVTAFAIVFALLSRVNFKEHRLKRKQDKLKQINQIALFNGEVTAQWEVYFGSIYDHDPHPMNIKLYCNRHKDMGMPILIKRGVCPACQEDHEYDMKAIETFIESYLHNEWGKIKK